MNSQTAVWKPVANRSCFSTYLHLLVVLSLISIYFFIFYCGGTSFGLTQFRIVHLYWIYIKRKRKKEISNNHTVSKMYPNFSLWVLKLWSQWYSINMYFWKEFNFEGSSVAKWTNALVHYGERRDAPVWVRAPPIFFVLCPWYLGLLLRNRPPGCIIA